MSFYWAMMLSNGGSARRCLRAMTIQQMHPVAHWPLVLGVLRRLEVATLIDYEASSAQKNGKDIQTP